VRGRMSSRKSTPGFALLGEAPSAAVADRPDLWLLRDETGVPHSANRLRDAGGMTTAEFKALFPLRTNLWRHGELRDGKYPIDLALARYLPLVEAVSVGEVLGIVHLGAQVRGAVLNRLVVLEDRWPLLRTTLESGGPFALLDAYGVTAWLPHPSGRCRWWNAPGNRHRAAEVIETLRRLRGALLAFRR